MTGYDSASAADLGFDKNLDLTGADSASAADLGFESFLEAISQAYGLSPNKKNQPGKRVILALDRQLAKVIGAFSEEPLAPAGDNENSADPDFEKEYRLRGADNDNAAASGFD